MPWLSNSTEEVRPASTAMSRAPRSRLTNGRRAAPPGCHVIATARNVDVLKGVSDMGMSAVQLDVTDPASIAACKAEVARITGGKLDVLVNNA